MIPTRCPACRPSPAPRAWLPACHRGRRRRAAVPVCLPPQVDISVCRSRSSLALPLVIERVSLRKRAPPALEPFADTVCRHRTAKARAPNPERGPLGVPGYALVADADPGNPARVRTRAALVRPDGRNTRRRGSFAAVAAFPVLRRADRAVGGTQQAAALDGPRAGRLPVLAHERRRKGGPGGENVVRHRRNGAARLIGGIGKRR